MASRSLRSTSPSVGSTGQRSGSLWTSPVSPSTTSLSSSPNFPRGLPSISSSASPTSKNRKSFNIEESKANRAVIDPELTLVLQRRKQLVDTQDGGIEVSRKVSHKIHVYAEFKEYTARQITEYEQIFNTFDADHDGYLEWKEIRLLVEKLGALNSLAGLKRMIDEIGEGKNGRISFREFLLITRKLEIRKVHEEKAPKKLGSYANLGEGGVEAAKKIFEVKGRDKVHVTHQEAVRQEQPEDLLEKEEQAQRREQFLAKKAVFENTNS